MNYYLTGGCAPEAGHLADSITANMGPKWFQNGCHMPPKWLPGGFLERLGLLEVSWSAPECTL